MGLALDEAIVDPCTYADPQAYHDLFARLRAEAPVRWTEPKEYRPFWTITKHADILEIERQGERFLNEPRLNLLTHAEEARIRDFTGGSHLVLRMLVNMDGDEHRLHRSLTQAWFMPANLKRLEEGLARLAREHVDRLETLGPECDFAQDVAVWFPLRVIMMILGVPPQDEALMLSLTQDLLGASDAEVARDRPSKEILVDTVKGFFDYFTELSAERRRNPRDDLASVIATAEVDGRPISEFEALSYYVIVATAGHDTTSSTIAGGLLALLEHPGELQRLRENPALLPGAVEEMVRWVAPVRHFFRTAAEPYELRGQQIRAGDALMMCYPSGNRDEDVFDDPSAFRIDRSPNRHLSFGYGPHVCLGMHLAKMEMRALFKELLARVDRIELAGEPALTAANFVNGLKRLPIRYAMRA
jgi:hypothetical protein